MNCPAFLSKFIAIGVKYLSMARKKWEFPPYVDRCLRQRWRKMVNQGIATKQQAYTLGWMEFFIDALFMMGAIDFPSDESAILRVKAFAEAMVNTEYVRRDEGEPSYLFEDGEEVKFAVGGMLCGTPEKDVFSALLITTKRIFAFDSMKAPRGPGCTPRTGQTGSGSYSHSHAGSAPRYYFCFTQTPELPFPTWLVSAHLPDAGLPKTVRGAAFGGR